MNALVDKYRSGGNLAALVAIIALASAIRVFNVSSSMVLLYSVVVIVAGLMLWRPRYALYGILLYSPYYFISNDLLTSGRLLGITTRFSPVDAFLAIGLVSVTTRLVRATRAGISPCPTDVFTAGWCLVSCIALAHGLISEFEAALRTARGPLLFGVYFIAASEIKTVNHLRALWRVLVWGSLIMGVVGVLGSVNLLSELFPLLRVGVVGGLFTRPNFFVEPALCVPYIVFLSMLLQFEERTRVKRSVIVAALLTNVAVLMLSVTRGFWAGMTAALGTTVLTLLSGRRVRPSSLVTVLVGVVSSLIVVEVAAHLIYGVDLASSMWTRMLSAIRGEDYQSVQYRFREFRTFARSFLETPITGKGFGSVVPGYDSGFSHNEYIGILHATGLLGAGTMLGMFYFGIVTGFQSGIESRSATQANEHTLLLARTLLVATTVGFAVISISSPEFTNPTTVPILAALLGAGRSFSRRPVPG